MGFPRIHLHVGDYLKQTAHFCTKEHGGYVLLLMHYWSNDGLPNNDKQLASITHMTAAEWRKHKPTIQALFDSGWRNPKLDAELADAQAEYERRSQAGKKGNAKRWRSARHSHADRFASGASSQCDRNASALRSPPLASPHGEESQQEKISPPVEESVVEGQAETRSKRGGV